MKGYSLMNDIPSILNKAFQGNEIIPETILEVVWHIRYLTQSGKQNDYTEESSVLKEYFSSMIHFDMINQVEDCSLTIRYSSFAC